MDVQDAGRKRAHEVGRDDLPVVGEDTQPRAQSDDLGDRRRRPDARRLKQPDVQLAGSDDDGRRRQSPSPAGGSIRGGDDGDEAHVGRRRDDLEDRDGERAGSEEDRPRAIRGIRVAIRGGGHASAVAAASASSPSSPSTAMSSSIESR